MKNRRFNNFIFILFVLTSVFLFFSCGEPSFISLPNIDDAITKEDYSTETGISFSVSSNDSDMNLITNGPGLVLSYIVFDNNSDRDSMIVNPPANAFETGSLYNIRSNFSSLVSHGTLSINSDHSILNTNIPISGYSTSQTNFTLKSFKIGTDSRASSPTFHLNINKKSVFNNHYVFELVDKSLDNCSFRLTGPDGVSNIYCLSETFEPNDKVSIVCFASFTSGFGNFNSAPIFSVLTYIGTIDINFNN